MQHTLLLNWLFCSLLVFYSPMTKADQPSDQATENVSLKNPVSKSESKPPSAPEKPINEKSEIKTELKDQAQQQDSVLQKVKTEKVEAQIDQANAEKRARSAEKSVEAKASQNEKDLALFFAEIQQYRADLSAAKLLRVKEINSKIETIKIRTNALKQYEAQLSNELKTIQIKELENASQIWRSVVDDSTRNLLAGQSFNTPKLPVISGDIDLSDVDLKPLKDKIQKAIDDAKKETIDAEKSVNKLQKAENDLQVRLLLIAGRIRSQMMNHLIESKKYSVWSFEENYFQDMTREIQIVPYRIAATFLEKYYDFRTLSIQGTKGWIKIFRQLSLIVLFFVSPIFLLRVFNRFSTYLDLLRREVFSWDHLEFQRRALLATWIGRVNPYLPWFFAFVAIQLTQSLLLNTFVEPLLVILDYLTIYVFYRIFNIGLSSVLAKVLLSKSLEKVRSKRLLVQRVARRLSILVFSQWAFLHAIEDVVRQAIIYNLVFDIVIVVNLLIFAIEATRWKDELQLLAVNWLNSKILEFIKGSTSRIVIFITCPFLLSGNIIYLLVHGFYVWIGRFELGKKVSSELFKKRLQEAVENKANIASPLDDDYVSLFTDKHELDANSKIHTARPSEKKACEVIDRWCQGNCREDLLLLHGYYGIGKSTLIQSLIKRYEDKATIKHYELGFKITEPSQVFQLVSELIGQKIESPEDLEIFDRTCERMIIIIDDIHNFYLNCDSGLEAYRTLIALTSTQVDNILWCFTCDQRALNHLNGLFGNNHFLGEKIEIEPWSDAEIQNLILKRHQRSGIPLVFDHVISAVHKGDVVESATDLEVQFFRLLWRQSRGNPKTALQLWLSSAYLNALGSVRISVPQFANSKILAELNDDTSMVFASLVRHENLTAGQLAQVCDLPYSVLSYSLKLGEDSEILQRCDDASWRIHPRAQFNVHSHLLDRNMIYG